MVLGFGLALHRPTTRLQLSRTFNLHVAQDVMSYTNLIFTVIFGLEALLKIVAFGPWNYLRDSWNAFDFFVVIISVASVILDFSNTKNLSFMPVLRVLRVVRVLRLVRTVSAGQGPFK